MRRLSIALLLLASCDKKSPPAGEPVPPAKIQQPAAENKPKPEIEKEKEKEKEPEPEPTIVEGSPFTLEDLRSLGFPKALNVARHGAPNQNKFMITGYQHAINLYVEWEEPSDSADKGFDRIRKAAADLEGAKVSDETRHGAKGYFMTLERKSDEVTRRQVEIGFIIGKNVVRVLTGNLDQEVLVKELEKVARGAAEKLAARLK